MIRTVGSSGAKRDRQATVLALLVVDHARGLADRSRADRSDRLQPRTPPEGEDARPSLIPPLGKKDPSPEPT